MKGKAKAILESSIDSALLAVEIYNKPRATFRTQAYIALMIMAWTRLFHCYFYSRIGDKFYLKDPKNKRYIKIDGERRAWSLSDCMKEYGKLREDVRANLNLFIPLRNKIEHRHINKHEFDVILFGECQAFLFNYETQLIEWFGAKYALNENIVFSLQFSQLRQEEQKKANKSNLSSDLQDIKNYIDCYRSALPDDVFSSSCYSIKLINIPKISNTNRNDIAIEFIKWDSLTEEERSSITKITSITKDRIIHRDVINDDGVKPSAILQLVKKGCGVNLSHCDHKCLYICFSIRPRSKSSDPSNTNPEYCLYDSLHKDYVYKIAWAEKLIEILKLGKLKSFIWKSAFKNNRTLKFDDYL
ncbi:Protein of uncharacterised function (DUF3644) [Legionella donaldsonii]|uniref:Protein of uncharacterized function (DUF3644) n=1 Tax=Legionella donaldsonii TaxID=45060 RepID=A0A378J164_9GAMM|nr:DUF3644 domain-containing protein [Legionella donaldsonii]STX41136.1 Protein of uncharacterised function (DUF3644) [Legionella donaldsonii]